MWKEMSIYHVRIPMRAAFGHARASRSQADNVLVKVTLDDGTSGWGEAVPRAYVTGETVESVASRLQEDDVTALGRRSCADFADVARQLFEARLPQRLSGDGSSNAAACALETAVLDAHARREQRNLFDVLTVIEELAPLRRTHPPPRVRQTLTVGDDLELALELAGPLDAPLDVKAKVGFGVQRDVERLQRLREALGPNFALRLDANCAWSLAEARTTLSALAPFGPISIEEPLPARAWDDYAELARDRALPIMIDESLCSISDAQQAHDRAAAQQLNLRISKCGGILETMRIAAYARSVGLEYQLGAMVGEAGILVALGRSFASRVEGVQHLEGSVPAFLLESDITNADFELEPRSRTSRVLDGPGFGATVEIAAVERYARAMISVGNGT